MEEHTQGAVGEVVVVAEAQGSVHSEPVPPSEPPQSETGDGVHKDAHVPYYTQGQSGVLGNPQMVVMSPYHSMVRPTARYADDAHPLAMHMQQGALVPGTMQQPASAHFIMPMMGPGGVPLSPNSLHKAQAAQWPAVVFSRGPDKKKRQREDFNTAQLKRLVEVYDMHETERPDREQLAKELDGYQGGRNVDAQAIKAWMKNRYHSLKRTNGTRSLVPGERKERQDFNSSQLKRLLEVYEMDPAHRPDREMVAKEIDKLDGGRPVTHYDVLAWMQTRKRMIKKKDERQQMLKEHLRAPSMLGPQTPVSVGQSWHVQQPFLVHPPMGGQVVGVDGQPPPPPTDAELALTPGIQGSAANVGMVGHGVVTGMVGGGMVGASMGGGLASCPLAAKLHKADGIKRPRMDYNDAQVFRLVQAYESGEKQDTEKLAKELDGLEGGRSVDATAVKAWLKNRLRFSESERKKRQRYDFNQPQLKRLLEVYEMNEADRPDREALAQELDAMDGGRRVTRADVKAWLKNRHHANRRRSGQEPNMSLHAKLRKGQHGEFKRPRLISPGPSQDHQGPSSGLVSLAINQSSGPSVVGVGGELQAHRPTTIVDDYYNFVSHHSTRFSQYLQQQQQQHHHHQDHHMEHHQMGHHHDQQAEDAEAEQAQEGEGQQEADGHDMTKDDGSVEHIECPAPVHAHDEMGKDQGHVADVVAPPDVVGVAGGDEDSDR